jgi:hypothetical protein
MKKAPLLATAAMALVLQLEAQVFGPAKMAAAEFAQKIANITGITPPETNPNDSVAIWPYEFEEFNKHVEGAKSPRFTPEEQAENIKRLVEHWIDRETAEFERPLQDPDALWSKASNPDTWSDVGIMTHAKKGTNGKTVIIIPQEHETRNSDTQHLEHVRTIQEQARKIMTRAYELGIETFGTETALESDFIFDNEFDVRTFGLEDEISQDSSEIIKSLKPLFARELKKTNDIATLIGNVEYSAQNFDDLEHFDAKKFVTKILGTAYGQLTKEMKKQINATLREMQIRIFFTLKNPEIVKQTGLLFETNKTNAAGIKYGAEHCRDKYATPIQDIFEEQGYTTIIVEIPDLHEETPVFPDKK